MLVTCLKGTWMIEQPASSRLVWYPRWEKFLASSWMRVWRVGWWSRHYGALSPMLVFQFEGQSFPETCIFKIIFYSMVFTNQHVSLLQEAAPSMEQHERDPRLGPWKSAASRSGKVHAPNHQEGAKGRRQSHVSRDQRSFEKHPV